MHKYFFDYNDSELSTYCPRINLDKPILCLTTASYLYIFGPYGTPETTERVNLSSWLGNARQRDKGNTQHLPPAALAHTHSPQPSWVHHAHRWALRLSGPDDCALTRLLLFLPGA